MKAVGLIICALIACACATRISTSNEAYQRFLDKLRYFRADPSPSYVPPTWGPSEEPSFTGSPLTDSPGPVLPTGRPMPDPETMPDFEERFYKGFAWFALRTCPDGDWECMGDVFATFADDYSLCMERDPEGAPDCIFRMFVNRHPDLASAVSPQQFSEVIDAFEQTAEHYMRPLFTALVHSMSKTVPKCVKKQTVSGDVDATIECIVRKLRHLRSNRKDLFNRLLKLRNKLGKRH